MSIVETSGSQPSAWCQDGQTVAADLGTDPATGLTDAEAARRLRLDGPNVITTERSSSVFRSIGGQLKDTMILILLAAGALTIATGDFADAAVILLVVVVNSVVGVVQERRALGAVEALRSMAAPTGVVRRAGVTIEIPTADVVLGDILVLCEGDVVPADARLLTADDLEVDEALLTGESLPSARDVAVVADPAAPIGDRRCLVHGGTLVLHGTGTGVVIATGERSAIGGIAELLHNSPAPATPLQRQLARLGRQISILAIASCAVVAALGLLQGQSWELVLVTAISLAVAAIPESLPAVVALSLAAGARRMARHGAIIRTLAAVETLGSVTVLASDKTGTLTSGDMAVVATWTPASGEQDLDEELLTAAVLCNDAEIGTTGSPTELALIDGATRAGLDVLGIRAKWPRLSVVPFDRDRRDMSTTQGGPGGPFVITKGAPEAVLQLGTDPPGPDGRTGLAVAAAWAGLGRRVIAISRSSGNTPYRLLGLVAIADPIRPEAPAAIQACRDAGITTVLITGDHPGTADAIARQTGLLNPATDGAGRVQPRVYARADPVTKLRLINAWQHDGQVVAMTGDGANDAPALHAADIGVAMGRRGTDVARGAADVVLTDDSFATIVTAVAEGRRVFDNIRRFVRYGLAGGGAEIAIMLLAPLLGFPLPLLAGQILWINLLTHGLPGVAMGAEVAEPDVLRRPPRPPGEPIMTPVLIIETVILGLALTVSGLAAAAWTRAGGGAWQSVLFGALAVGQLGLALTTRSDHRPAWRLPMSGNPMLLGAVALSTALVLAALYLPPLQTLLRTVALGPAEVLTILVAAAVPAVVAQLLVPFRNRQRSGPGPKSRNR